VTTAPCAEVGLAPDDTCLFAYVNAAAFATSTTREAIDYAGIARTVGLAVRGLDDLLDADVDHLGHALSRSLAWAKRRIGIGLRGFADLLLWQGITYASPLSLDILGNVLSVMQSGRAAILLHANTSIEPFLVDPRRTALTAGLRRHAATMDDGVSQAGAPALRKKTRSVTRFEYSVGVWSLANQLEMPLERQVTALLHDATHTAFSHTADYLFYNRAEDFHEKQLGRLMSDQEVCRLIAPGTARDSDDHHGSPVLVEADRCTKFQPEPN